MSHADGGECFGAERGGGGKKIKFILWPPRHELLHPVTELNCLFLEENVPKLALHSSIMGRIKIQEEKGGSAFPSSHFPDEH